MEKSIPSLLILLLMPLLFSCFNADKEQDGAVEEDRTINVRLTPVIRDNMERRVLLSGEVRATRMVKIFPDVSGLLKEIRVEPGDRIDADQIVAVIDPSRPGLSYGESPVRSKAPGTVIAVPAIVGNLISTQTVIAETGDLDRLEIECRVPERYISLLRQGLIARISSRAYPEDRTAARVTHISPVVDPFSRTIAVKLTPERTETLRPGQSVTVGLILETLENVLLIPASALTERYGEEGVFCVNQNRAQWKSLTIGLRQAGMVQVIQGLSEGDHVVTAGIDLLTDGIPLQVLE